MCFGDRNTYQRHLERLLYGEDTSLLRGDTLLCFNAILLFHEAKLLRDEDTLVDHGEACFGGRSTLLPPGNTYFRHANTWFREGLNCF